MSMQLLNRCPICLPAALLMFNVVVLCSFAGDDAGVLAAADPTGRLLIWRIQMDPEADATTLEAEELLNLTFDGQSKSLVPGHWQPAISRELHASICLHGC